MSVINPGTGARETTAEGWQPYLDQGERLLWEGAPATGLRLRSRTILSSLFGLVFGGFAVFWIAGAAAASDGTPMGFFFPLFGLPFLAVGIYLSVGHLFWDSYVRGRTRYALTDRRAIIAKSALRRSLKSYPIDAETPIEIQPGEEATIWFAKEIRRGSKGRRYSVRIGFEYISDGEKVYEMVRGIQQRGRE